MNRDGENRKGPSFTSLVAFGIFALPMLYVLSVGPAATLVHSEYVSEEAIMPYYWPIVQLHDRVAWFERALNWYMDFWH